MKPARQVSPAEPIVIHGGPDRFVGRGAHKLEAALDRFGIDVTQAAALDAGASTGGFTDALLQRGAQLVAAVDVGTNQLHERLQANPKVKNLQQVDIRAFDPADTPGLPDTFQIIGVDLSFISTTSLLPVFTRLLAPNGDLIILVKPQFEAGRAEVSKGRGIIRDPLVWKRVLHDLIDASVPAGLAVRDLAISPITGGKGNVEFLAHLGNVAATRHTESVTNQIGTS